MERGLYIGASGMLAEQVRQDLIAHDLANASTPGYKAERVTTRSFGQMLLRDSSSGPEIGSLGTGTQQGTRVELEVEHRGRRHGRHDRRVFDAAVRLQSALRAGAGIVQTSLLDFLR